MNRTKEYIKKYGWAYMYVFDPDGEHENFGYTIGLEEIYQHPEVLVFGLSKENTYDILSNIVEDISNGSRFQKSMLYDKILGDNFYVKFEEIKSESLKVYLGQACDYYKKMFQALVMLWPDKYGIFPGEKTYSLTEQLEALELI